MMSFFKDANFARSTPARIASYLVSLLDAGKYSRMACYIISPVGALSCKLTPTPIWLKASSTLRIHQPALPWSTSGWGNSAKKSTNICSFNARRGLY